MAMIEGNGRQSLRFAAFRHMRAGQDCAGRMVPKRGFAGCPHAGALRVLYPALMSR